MNLSVMYLINDNNEESVIKQKQKMLTKSKQI